MIRDLRFGIIGAMSLFAVGCNTAIDEGRAATSGSSAVGGSISSGGGRGQGGSTGCASSAPIVIASNQSYPRLIGADAEGVYWAAGEAIYKYAFATDATSTLAAGDVVEGAILISDGIYSTTTPNGSTIIRIPLDGGPIVKVGTPPPTDDCQGPTHTCQARGLAIDDTLYFSSDGALYGMPKTGGSATAIYAPDFAMTDAPGAVDVAISGAHLFFVGNDASHASGVYRLEKTGDGLSKITDGTENASSLRAVDSVVYAIFWDGSSPAALRSTPAEGGAWQTLLSSVSSYAVDESRVWFTDGADVRFIPKGGGAQTTLAKGSPGTVSGSVAVNADSVFWTNGADGAPKSDILYVCKPAP